MQGGMARQFVKRFRAETQRSMELVEKEVALLDVLEQATATATATAGALSATHVAQLRDLLHARAAMSAALEQELDVLVAQA